MEPLFGFSNPESAFSVVDFPAPFPPIKAMICPLATEKLTSRSTSVAPYQTLRFFTLSMNGLTQVRLNYRWLPSNTVGITFRELYP